MKQEKFDVSTLKPFDKVLVRDESDQCWACNFISHLEEKWFPFICVGGGYKYCIPYEGNEHLLGTDDDCDEYYKTWEE